MEKKEHSGSMSYPKKGSVGRIIYKLPLLLWRMGFGPILSHPSRGGRKMMVVTTRGRKSKLPRHTMVSNIRFDQKDYAVSGWWKHSDWVKNFLEDPLVTIQSGSRIYSAQARRVETDYELKGVAQALFRSGGDSHFKEWLSDLEIDYDIGDLLEKRERVYIVGFDPVKMEGPHPLSADLIWIWAFVFSSLLGIIFFLL